MFSVLAVGFVIGMQHALEVDHLAAVTSLVCGKSSIRRIVRDGAIWGIGHALILSLVGGTAVLLKASIGPGFSAGIELVVGVMLFLLGGHVFYRLWRDRVHVHPHRHADGTVHMHVHSHAGEVSPHTHSAHRHIHPDRGWMRTLAVGIIHGLVGTAALLVLTATSMETPLLGLLYILLFGAGSIVGMAALSAVIAIPISFTANTFVRANKGLRGLVGIATMGIGGAIIARTGAVFLGV
ncbi:MAG: urease accessory protein [Alphaproteobacteria bacterium]